MLEKFFEELKLIRIALEKLASSPVTGNPPAGEDAKPGRKKKTDPAPEPGPEQVPEVNVPTPAPAPDKPKVDGKTAGEKLLELAKRDTPTAVAILAKYNATEMKQLPPEHYADVFTAAEEALKKLDTVTSAFSL